MMREGEDVCDEFSLTGFRTQRAFMLLESEMDMLVWAPWWVRRSIIKRVKAETRFDDRDTDGSPEGPDPQGLDGEAATAGAEGIAHPLDFP